LIDFIDKDPGRLIGTRTAIGAAEQTVASARDTGLTRKDPLDRHYRDVLGARMQPPRNGSAVAPAGQSVLGAPGPSGLMST
jgi:hypothetical protein